MRADVEVILKIPTPRETSPDEVMWHFDKWGEYSVKSGYQLAVRDRYVEATSSTTSSSNQWNLIWMLELLEKMKIFMWRATKNLLPSAENLWKRKILQELIC